MTAATLEAAPLQGRSGLTNAAIIIVVGVLATTLAQPQVLGRLPIQNLLKNELHVPRDANAAFFFLSALPWYFKPVAGILTDAFPIFGSRRRSYIVISSCVATLAWIGLLFTPHEYGKLLWACIAINIFMVAASTVVGGYMVETAQAVSGSGRLTALRNFVEQVCLIIRGPSAGYLASIAFGWTAGACGGVMFLLVPVTVLFLAEQRRRVASRQMLAAAGRQLGAIGSAGAMWSAAGLMLVFYAAPGIGTAQFYLQQNQLHMNPQGQGFLGFIYGCCGIAAAVGYGFACRRWNLRRLLPVCLLAAAASHVGFQFYGTVGQAQIVAGLDGFGFTLGELALMDLAVRATPAGSEGLGFSLLMSARNVALFSADWLGSAMIERLHLSFGGLAIVNAAVMALAAPLVLLLPRVLVRRRDAELYEELPETASAPQG